MATHDNKPVATLRSGGIKATIWRNAGAKGPFYSMTFSRPFKGREGEWRNSTSFGLSDLGALSILTVQAKQWIIDRADR